MEKQDSIPKFNALRENKSKENTTLSKQHNLIESKENLRSNQEFEVLIEKINTLTKLLSKSKAETKKYLALMGHQNGTINKLNVRIDNVVRGSKKLTEEKSIYSESNQHLIAQNKQYIVQIENLDSVINSNPNVNAKLKKSFEENNKILQEKINEIENLKLEYNKLNHEVVQIRKDKGLLLAEIERCEIKNDYVCSLLKSVTEHLGPAFTECIANMIDCRTDLKSEISLIYENTIESLENLYIRLEHRLLEYQSPLLDDYLKMEYPNRQTPHFSKKDFMSPELRSNYLSRGTIEKLSTERETRRSEIENLIMVFYRIIECLKQNDMNGLIEAFDAMLVFLKIDSKTIDRIKDHLKKVSMFSNFTQNSDVYST